MGWGFKVLGMRAVPSPQCVYRLVYSGSRRVYSSTITIEKFFFYLKLWFSRFSKVDSYLIF